MKTIRMRIGVLAVVALMVGEGAWASEGSPAVQLGQGGGFSGSSEDRTTSYTFRVDIPMCIRAIGCYSNIPPFIFSDHSAAILNTSGDVLASATINFLDDYQDGFYYETIPPLCLQAGETYIARATYPGTSSASALVREGPGRIEHPAITIVSEGRVDFGAGFLIGDDCLSGTVDNAAGQRIDVLRVSDGGTAEDQRIRTIAAGDPVWGTVLTPPGGSNGKFVVHANPGTPDLFSLTDLPSGIGTTCFPLLIENGASPVAVWNNLGRPDRLGSSQYFGESIPSPSRTASVFFEFPSGDSTNLPPGTTLTFQGAVVDQGSSASRPVSTTNAVVLRIE